MSLQFAIIFQHHAVGKGIRSLGTWNRSVKARWFCSVPQTIWYLGLTQIEAEERRDDVYVIIIHHS